MHSGLEVIDTDMPANLDEALEGREPKVPTMYHLPASTAEAVRQCAKDLGVSASRLAAVALLGTITRQRFQLEAWARGLNEEKRRAEEEAAAARRKRAEARKVAPSTRAVRVLAALERIVKVADCTTHFAHQEIATAAGTLRKDAQDALAELRTLGKASGCLSEKLDPWGRPEESFWTAVGVEPAVRRKWSPEEPQVMPDDPGDGLYRATWREVDVWRKLGAKEERLVELARRLRELFWGAECTENTKGLCELLARIGAGLSPACLALRPRLVPEPPPKVYGEAS